MRSRIISVSRRGPSLLAWLAPLAFAWACGGTATDSSRSGASTGDAAPKPLPAKCTLNSDCTAPLVCKFGRCHGECAGSRDCPQGQRCIVVATSSAGATAGVCQLQFEAHCAFNSDCQPPLVCAADSQCRNECIADRDCAAGQLCVSGSCADPIEITSEGGLTGAGGAPTTGPTKCTLNSDCNGGMVCAFGLCHAECMSSRDCPAPERCILSAPGGTGSGGSVCQLAPEVACHYASDCSAPLVCAADLQCRNECQTDRDCITGQRCAIGNVCAEPQEINPDGSLKGVLDGGSP